jgi:hypothetical protein
MATKAKAAAAQRRLVARGKKESLVIGGYVYHATVVGRHIRPSRTHPYRLALHREVRRADGTPKEYVHVWPLYFETWAAAAKTGRRLLKDGIGVAFEVLRQVDPRGR